MVEWLFKNRTGDVSNVLEIIATDLTKVQLAVMAQEKAAGMIAKAIAKSEIVLTQGPQHQAQRQRDRDRLLV